MKRSPAITASRRPCSRATWSDSTPRPRRCGRWRGENPDRARPHPGTERNLLVRGRVRPPTATRSGSGSPRGASAGCRRRRRAPAAPAWSTPSLFGSRRIASSSPASTASRSGSPKRATRGSNVCGGEDGFPRPGPSRRSRARAPDAARPPPRRGLALPEHPPGVTPERSDGSTPGSPTAGSRTRRPQGPRFWKSAAFGSSTPAASPEAFLLRTPAGAYGGALRRLDGRRRGCRTPCSQAITGDPPTRLGAQDAEWRTHGLPPVGNGAPGAT